MPTSHDLTNLKAIRDHWKEQARCQNIEYAEVTHRDVWQRWLEIETIKKFLSPDNRLLDVGCGNGLSTLAVAPFVKEVVGIDYCEEMIERAREALALKGEESKQAIEFTVADILDLNPSYFGLFDVVISTRCLINLGTWESQQRAISNIASVLEQGGIFLFVEGRYEGRRNLNRLREKVGLTSMKDVWFNLDFREERTLAYLKRFFGIEQRLHFGTYDFLSRIVHPVLVAPAEPEYKSRINEIAARLAFDVQEFDYLSRVFFLVLRKS